MRKSFIDFVGSVQRPAYAALLKVLVRGFFGSIILLGFATAHPQAAEKTLVNKGKVLVEQNCSRCHAIGKEGDSPHPQAPPLRTLSRKYPIEDLADSLAEGICLGPPRHARLRVQSARCRGYYPIFAKHTDREALSRV